MKISAAAEILSSEARMKEEFRECARFSRNTGSSPPNLVPFSSVTILIAVAKIFSSDARMKELSKACRSCFAVVAIFSSEARTKSDLRALSICSRTSSSSVCTKWELELSSWENSFAAKAIASSDRFTRGSRMFSAAVYSLVSPLCRELFSTADSRAAFDISRFSEASTASEFNTILTSSSSPFSALRNVDITGPGILLAKGASR
mmetsp:Transcript_28198/g.62445  ORF Transcript_28198/g.62445 Transcript_28198/m.62445 type:complete len:205 (+) Transcript_28198:738-1352(+)